MCAPGDSESCDGFSPNALVSVGVVATSTRPTFLSGGLVYTLTFILNTITSAVVISLAAWLADAYPRLAGFVIALPLATLLAWPMAHQQSHDTQHMEQLAISVLVAVPVAMFFLVPFVLALRHGLSFWASYALACVWLVPGFFLHRWLTKLLGKIALPQPSAPSLRGQ